MRAARPTACPLEAQADATANAWPWMPWRIEIAAAAAFGMYIGMPSGEIRVGALLAHQVEVDLDGVEARRCRWP